jgi:hypothetical protein
MINNPIVFPRDIFKLITLLLKIKVSLKISYYIKNFITNSNRFKFNSNNITL